MNILGAFRDGQAHLITGKIEGKCDNNLSTLILIKSVLKIHSKENCFFNIFLWYIILMVYDI